MPHRDGDDQAEFFPAAALPVAPLDDASRIACLRLIRSENVGPVTFRQLINHYGGAQAALDALPEIARRAGRGKPVAVCPAGRADAELEAAAKAGAVAVFTIEPGYPAILAAAAAPPPLLYVKGNVGLLNKDTVAIVGSRDCSAAGVKLTAQLAAELSQAGYVIASGLARGIDGAAHRSALAGGTIAVVAGGIDVIYPPEHAGLYAEIAERGCVVTELPPGYVARAKDFPRRNRIIAGVALGVVIVEAAKRSGSLVTARYAIEQDREVFAVPGHPLDPRAAGPNGLIKNGATLTTCAADILEVLGPITNRAPVQLAEAKVSFAAPPPVALPHASEHDLETVAASLGPHPIDIDGLVQATGLTARAVQIAVLELDLAGRIERHGGQLVSLRAG